MDDGAGQALDGANMERRTLAQHTKPVYCVAFSEHEPLLASGSSDNSVIVWDVALGRARRTLRQHSAWVEALAWSPHDASLLASASGDATVVLWDARGGAARAALPRGAPVRARSRARRARPRSRRELPAHGAALVRRAPRRAAAARHHARAVEAVLFFEVGRGARAASSDAAVALWDGASVWDARRRPAPTTCQRRGRARARCGRPRGRSRRASRRRGPAAAARGAARARPPCARSQGAAGVDGPPAMLASAATPR